jgi:hypothetical protein
LWRILKTLLATSLPATVPAGSDSDDSERPQPAKRRRSSPSCSNPNSRRSQRWRLELPRESRSRSLSKLPESHPIPVQKELSNLHPRYQSSRRREGRRSMSISIMADQPIAAAVVTMIVRTITTTTIVNTLNLPSGAGCLSHAAIQPQSAVKRTAFYVLGISVQETCRS